MQQELQAQSWTPSTVSATESTVAVQTLLLSGVRRRGDLQRLGGTPGEALDQQAAHRASLPLQLCDCHLNKQTGPQIFYFFEVFKHLCSTSGRAKLDFEEEEDKMRERALLIPPSPF